jgi:hypothetical protein
MGRCIFMKSWWYISIGMAMVALVIVRVQTSYSATIEEDSTSDLKYVCIGEHVVKLGSTEARHSIGELRLDLPFSRAKRICQLPGVPQTSKPIIAASAPGLGWSVNLQWTPLDTVEALDDIRFRFARGGWTETSGSRMLGKRTGQRHPAAAFSHDGVWLLMVVVPDSGESGSYLLSAGHWPRRRKR